MASDPVSSLTEFMATFMQIVIYAVIFYFLLRILIAHISPLNRLITRTSQKPMKTVLTIHVDNERKVVSIKFMDKHIPREEIIKTLSVIEDYEKQGYKWE